MSFKADTKMGDSTNGYVHPIHLSIDIPVCVLRKLIRSYGIIANSSPDDDIAGIQLLSDNRYSELLIEEYLRIVQIIFYGSPRATNRRDFIGINSEEAFNWYTDDSTWRIYDRNIPHGEQTDSRSHSYGCVLLYHYCRHFGMPDITRNTTMEQMSNWLIIKFPKKEKPQGQFKRKLADILLYLKGWQGIGHEVPTKEPYTPNIIGIDRAIKVYDKMGGSLIDEIGGMSIGVVLQQLREKITNGQDYSLEQRALEEYVQEVL